MGFNNARLPIFGVLSGLFCRSEQRFVTRDLLAQCVAQIHRRGEELQLALAGIFIQPEGVDDESDILVLQIPQRHHNDEFFRVVGLYDASADR